LGWGFVPNWLILGRRERLDVAGRADGCGEGASRLGALSPASGVVAELRSSIAQARVRP
jgi:hypothetical protein